MDKFEWPDSRESMEREGKWMADREEHTCSLSCDCFLWRLRLHVEALEAEAGRLREALEKIANRPSAATCWQCGNEINIMAGHAKAALGVCASDSGECDPQTELRVTDGAQNPVIYNGMTLPELLKRFDEYEAASGKGDLVIKGTGQEAPPAPKAVVDFFRRVGETAGLSATEKAFTKRVRDWLAQAYRLTEEGE